MDTYEKICGRLAPSPTGALHLGNARSFLLAWLSVRKRNGRMILRMEDLDHPKVKPAAARQALDDLLWLGLDWDEGPDCGGQYAPYVQSQRIALYQKALDKLIDKKLVYPCICSRRDVERAQSAPQEGEDCLFYHGDCRGRFADYESAARLLPDGRLPAWRFLVANGEQSFTDVFCGKQKEDVAYLRGDFVLARHVAGAGYMLAVVVDDAAMGVTEVLRGDDLLPATFRQIMLYHALDLTPPHFIHVPLVVGEDGRRLAKRHGDTRISALRENGICAEKIIGLLAWWCGWAEWGEEMTATELLPLFDLKTLNPHSVVVDQRVREYLSLKNLRPVRTPEMN